LGSGYATHLMQGIGLMTKQYTVQ